MEEKITKARELCQKVRELAESYDLPFFFVTDGASAVNNTNSSAIKNACDAHMKWELEHAIDPTDDWRMIITLDEYKKIIIGHYNWMVDKEEKQIEDRKRRLAKDYPDEYLEKIIRDTFHFIKELLTNGAIEAGYYDMIITEDAISYIDLFLHGGYASDTLIKDKQGRLISNSILYHVFGDRFGIDYPTDEIELDYGDTVSFDYIYHVVFSKFPDNIIEIKHRILCTGETRTRTGNNGI